MALPADPLPAKLTTAPPTSARTRWFPWSKMYRTSEVGGRETKVTVLNTEDRGDPSTAAPATPVPAMVVTTQGGAWGVTEGEGEGVTVAAGVGVPVGVAPSEGEGGVGNEADMDEAKSKNNLKVIITNWERD